METATKRSKAFKIQKVFHKVVTALILVLLVNCGSWVETTQSIENTKFFSVGHRGARGLMPENTIPAFKKAIELGTNTIEFDVHITKDKQVVIYHDSSLDPAYTTRPDGRDMEKLDRKKHILYQMDYNQIKKFHIGEKFYKSFPEQTLVSTHAPLLTEMIDEIEQFTKINKYSNVIYLLEVKSDPRTDDVEQPAPDDFMDVLFASLKPYLVRLQGRLIIQSFDSRPLTFLHRVHPNIPLGILVGDKNKTLSEYIAELEFVPQFYNPHFSFVDKSLIQECRTHNMKIVPWTVNEKSEVESLLRLHVNGVITDYPNILEEVLKAAR